MTPAYTIADLQPGDEDAIRQVAQILLDAFVDMAPDAWPGMDSALAEVRDSLEPGRVSRVAVTPDGTVLGWVGGIPEYDGHVWELHPLAVHPAYQGQGIGRALVLDFEAQVAARGALTVMLGTDDEAGWTTLSGVDLYENVWEHVRSIQNPGRHPYEFYQRLGYVITGVVPDANGWGKPDILMSKRVGKPPGTQS
jgi:aminoglycoside 6'-N-acetyltransferase I